ncbi:2,4-dienoyl-CoA reductase [Sphingomonas laterariae]|uniref:2,4-dienoyl-CoA reductase n=1 Tax=Edaphosphingomonas laterariae TaxID=861865 RepID=A0A239BUD2_9SPHN|nr:12-oxophytodienoate reductase [Sphingomonas laterariae]SNS11232.1 2,4-dienoyl-CoA reductase [Sphingomonas laterariae]
MSDPLFQPITIGTLALPNRIVMAPMGQGKAVGGVPDPGYPAYYARRAEGGVGLIVSGATAIGHAHAAFDENEPHFHGDAALAIWAQAIDAVHAAGGQMMPQIGHAGLQGLAPVAPPWPGIGPSAVWLPGAQVGQPAGPERIEGQPMTLAEIDTVIAAFVQAAIDAQRLGFDGVEVHGAHGFLIDQFLWARTNRRDDGFGRDRARFAADVIAAVRAAVGPDFPIALRFSQFKMTDYAARLAETPQELEALLRPLVDAGVDLFDCSLRRFWRAEFADDGPMNLAGWIRKLAGRPTIAGGGIGLAKTALEYGEEGVYGRVADASTAHLDDVRERLVRGEFDLVALGRSILGDAAWAAKVRDGHHENLQPYRPELLAGLN